MTDRWQYTKNVKVKTPFDQVEDWVDIITLNLRSEETMPKGIKM